MTGPTCEDAIDQVLRGRRSRALLDVVGQRWSALILVALHQRTCRHGELRRAVDGISPKALSRALHDLVLLGLVDRHDFGEIPPRVEYSLTASGEDLAELVEPLVAWVGRNPLSELPDLPD